MWCVICNHLPCDLHPPFSKILDLLTITGCHQISLHSYIPWAGIYMAINVVLSPQWIAHWRMSTKVCTQKQGWNMVSFSFLPFVYLPLICLSLLLSPNPYICIFPPFFHMNFLLLSNPVSLIFSHPYHIWLVNIDFSSGTTGLKI